MACIHDASVLFGFACPGVDDGCFALFAARALPSLPPPPPPAVHAWLYWQRMEGSAKEVRDLLKAAGPWWERNHGHDHIFISTCDDGRGWYAQPELFNVTMLHHYGSVAGEEIQLLHHCNTRKRWGGECDWAMTIGLNAARRKQFAPNHIPGRDIVLPPAGFEAREDTLPYVHPELRKELDQKNSILFYAGAQVAGRLASAS